MLRRPGDPGELEEEHNVPDVRAAFISGALMKLSSADVCHHLGKLGDHGAFH